MDRSRVADPTTIAVDGHLWPSTAVNGHHGHYDGHYIMAITGTPMAINGHNGLHGYRSLKIKYFGKLATSGNFFFN